MIAGEPQNRAGMQTLGAKNEFIRNKNRSTLDSKRPRNGTSIADHNGGLTNRSYVADSDEDDPINMSIYGPGSRHSASSGHNAHKRMSHNL